jgi:hypothetical protein
VERKCLEEVSVILYLRPVYEKSGSSVKGGVKKSEE